MLDVVELDVEWGEVVLCWCCCWWCSRAVSWRFAYIELRGVSIVVVLGGQ